MPWKLRLDNPNNTDPLFDWLNTGCVVEVFTQTISQIIWWTRHVDPLHSRCFIHLDMANPNALLAGGYNARWYFDFQVLTLPWWFCQVDEINPPGAYVPSNLYVNDHLPNLVPMAGLLTVTPVRWDTPSTVLV